MFYWIQTTGAIWLLLWIIIYLELGAGTVEQAELICMHNSSICMVTANEDTHLECSSTYLHMLIQAFCVFGTAPVRVTPTLLQEHARTHPGFLMPVLRWCHLPTQLFFFLYQFSHKLIASFGRLIDLRENRWWPQLLHAHLQYLKTQLNTFWPYCCNFYIFQLLKLITRINHKHPFPMDFHSEGCLR